MERLHSKQQNELRRKMEEAVAINKRLKVCVGLKKKKIIYRIILKDSLLKLIFK